LRVPLLELGDGHSGGLKRSLRLGMSGLLVSKAQFEPPYGFRECLDLLVPGLNQDVPLLDGGCRGRLDLGDPLVSFRV
jgi:hypothetical protein